MRPEYEDMIDLPHPVSRKHPQMSVHDRAAQFSPFAALTGYGDAIVETSRITDQRKELDEDERERLDEKLQLVMDCIEEHPMIEVTFFVKDPKKEGGEYKSVTQAIRKIDSYERTLIMQNGQKIRLDDIVNLKIRKVLSF